MSGIPADIGEHVSYDRASGSLVWRRTRGSMVAGAPVGTINADGYWRFQFRRKSLLVHRVVFFLLTGEQPEIVDHRDCNPLNNRAENLRAADPVRSSINRRRWRGSLPKGVRLNKGSTRFSAAICVDGSRRHLGSFDTPEEAHLAYREAAKVLHGEFARLT